MLSLEEIGKLIRKKRKEFGYSKEEFCALANISPRTLYKIEHNLSKNVRFETIQHLLNLIGYELEIKEK
jgi:transcriptional regulator with XRE-family HTH domain